jgi:threonine dehydrogenase-like Zn-dependent dehydrogenase
MKAIVYTAPLTLEGLEWPAPTPAEGEVLVEVGSVGICGSEVEGVRSRSPFRVPPLVMGHECAGTRTDTGERVAVNPIITCGLCDLCRAGITEVCRSRQIIGVHRPGAFAELVSVPTANCHPLPTSVSDIQGALVEPFANAVHARAVGLRLASPGPVRRIGVIGGGALGLAVCSLCAEDRSVEVTLCEIDERRRDSATGVAGVTVGAWLGQELDIVFDAVGTAETRAMSVDRLRPGGAAVWIGLHSPDAALDGPGVVRTEKRIAGSFAYSDPEFRSAVGAVERLQPAWAEPQPLSSGTEVFLSLLKQATSAPRTVLVSNRHPEQAREGGR